MLESDAFVKLVAVPALLASVMLIPFVGLNPFRADSLYFWGSLFLLTSFLIWVLIKKLKIKRDANGFMSNKGRVAFFVGACGLYLCMFGPIILSWITGEPAVGMLYIVTIPVGLGFLIIFLIGCFGLFSLKPRRLPLTPDNL